MGKKNPISSTWNAAKDIVSSGGNPLKKIGKYATDAVVNPYREAARAIGADGAVDWINKQKDSAVKIGEGVMDKVDGRAARLEKDAKEQQDKASAAASADRKQKQKLAQDTAFQASEAERMSGGSASKTLLTSGTGLEDEEDTISKRVLSGS